jgi:hypothetical protein
MKNKVQLPCKLVHSRHVEVKVSGTKVFPDHSGTEVLPVVCSVFLWFCCSNVTFVHRSRMVIYASSIIVFFLMFLLRYITYKALLLRREKLKKCAAI